MNHLEFHGSKVENDPQEYIDGIQKITQIISVTLIEISDLNVLPAKIWYKQ